MDLTEIQRLLHDFEVAVEALALARRAGADLSIVHKRKERVAELRAAISTAMLHAP